MAAYNNLADYYDLFTEDVDYTSRSIFLLSLFNKYHKKPTLLLDLACGTGGFSFELAKQNIDIIGVDCSEGMLSVAKSKQSNNSQNPLFLLQKAEDLELFGTVDGAICMLDSLNHITDYKNFCKAFKKVSLFLEKGCLFIFDLNTKYKHSTVLGNNSYIRESEKAFCVWQNDYIGNGTVDIYLDIFTTDDGINYHRRIEEFSEQAYSDSQLNFALADASLELVDCFDDTTYNPPTKESERITYIVRKI